MAINAKTNRSKNALAHVHETVIAVASVEMTPAHPPRVETPAYRMAHTFLVETKGAGCAICGVTKKTLKNPKKNPYGAKVIETHHYPIERSLMDACDPVKIHVDFPQVYDRATLEAWIDTPANLLVICDLHHRSLAMGIHHLVTQDWIVQKYLLDGYAVAATAANAATVEQHDRAIEVAAGMEQTAA